MSEPTNSSPSSRKRMLLWAAIISLAITNLITLRELSNAKREINSQRPLPAEEVARQFEKQTTLGPITVTVNDVRYSPQADSYRVDFSWKDTTTNQLWMSEVRLISDGFGKYYGQIANEAFITPLGRKESFNVSVKAPSPLGG